MFRSLFFKPEYMFIILIYGIRYRKKEQKKNCISSRSFRTCVYSSKLICFDFWQIGFLRKRLKWNGVATHTKEKCTRVCACVKESEREIYSWISEEIIVLHFLPLFEKCVTDWTNVVRWLFFRTTFDVIIIFWAAGAVSKIGSSLRPSYYDQI